MPGAPMGDASIPVMSANGGARGDLGAVVVTHNNAELALACVRSLGASVAAANRIVVVNSASDVCEDEVRELRSCARVVCNTSPVGYGENVNRGIEHLPASVDIVLVLNDDIVMDAEGIEHLAQEIRLRPDVAITGPRIIDPEGGGQASEFIFPSPWSEAAGFAILPSRINVKLGGRISRVAPAGVCHEVDWVLGAAFAMRRSAAEEVGGFDTRFFLYSEETDLCRRLHVRGWRIRSCGSTTAIHLGSSSTGDRRYAVMIGQSRGQYINLHWSLGARLAWLVSLPICYAWNLLYVLVRVLLAPRSARAKAALFLGHHRARPRVRLFPRIAPRTKVQ
jgi:N-acetylglucosaminyl-diphospho-decaprenol L-rhamnosyltransferase